MTAPRPNATMRPRLLNVAEVADLVIKPVVRGPEFPFVEATLLRGGVPDENLACLATSETRLARKSFC